MENSGDFTPRPGFVESIVIAFSKPGEYERFRKVKTLSAAGFLALILFISVLLGSIVITFKINRGVDEVADYYQKNLPEIRIKDGQVETDAPQPFVYKVSDKNNGEFVIIIDNTGKIKNLDEYPQGILLTKNELFNKKNRYNVQRTDLSSVKNFTLNKTVIMKWKKFLPLYLLPALIILGFMWESFKMVIFVPLMAFASKTVAGDRADYPFSQHANIAIYAAVPPILIMTAVNLFLTSLPGFLKGLTFFGIYLYFVLQGTNGLFSSGSESKDHRNGDGPDVIQRDLPR